MSLDRERDPERVVHRWNRAFTALAAEPRRQLVDALMDVSDDESVPLPEAAVNPRLSVDHDYLQVQLRHTHLPMLESHDYVRWEGTPLRASRGRRFEEVAVVFDSLYANAGAIPEQLVDGCRRLERRQERDVADEGGDSASTSD
ncbi:hypothetical protein CHINAEXTREME_05090 [Halobiforma lacisalsi AJ5]|uniref:Transcriptional regulator n=1 Tax=Natronobacterium lacisalsi AJ5 TaxID=358396 RepID=M0LPR7_NATLA|nr:hypothetical protein [Halobiforma lacisalsi]APW97182.1 hypothetical protein CHINAEXTREME_05090 [Halobiforma lacisalsi AJ5]EMA34015.1 hypothetical protein C445_08357 [Halobiforma lacisalsi AJ5]